MKQLYLLIFLTITINFAFAGIINFAFAEQVEPFTTISQHIFYETNKLRVGRGLKELKWVSLAGRIARSHSQNMVQKRFFDHKNPQNEWPWDRAQAAGLKFGALSENIYMGQSFVEMPQEIAKDGLKAWMQSAGHRNNILNPRWKYIGIGVAKRGNSYLLTQVFFY